MAGAAPGPCNRGFAKVHRPLEPAAASPLPKQPSLLPGQYLETSWMEVLEYNCLVCGFVSRPWHNVWPVVNIVNEETGPVDPS